MPKLYLTYGALMSPLGTTVQSTIDAVFSGVSGIHPVENAGFLKETLPLGKVTELTGCRYNALLTQALDELVETHPQLQANTTAIVLSSTKGNLDDIATDTFASSRKIIGDFYQDIPLTIISNACISGVLAINLAADMLRTSALENVVIIGIDALSDFVNFGFKSLYALSEAPCKPFDATRNGTSLGEACAIVLLSKNKPEQFAVEYLAGSSSNDANHISGPSRTGEGLVRSINRSLQRAGITASSIDFIGAHGTATVFNDEMESIAFGRLGMEHIPVHSLKGYFGHTLGAAGVLETMLLMASMEHQQTIASLGFETTGTSVALNVVQQSTPAKLNTVLKTASGFGGGNASLILKLQEA